MNIKKERVIEVHHCTDKLFTFKTTRDQSFRFENGHFTMIGLEVDGKPVMRAYSIASSNYEDYLNFISIKVPNGELTSRLQNIEVGDEILVSQKSVGTLTLDRLTPATNLYLLSTGTGLAPFISIIADPATYEKFTNVIVVHCCRHKEELIYGDYIKNIQRDEILEQFIRGKVCYYPTTTRDACFHGGRITDLIARDDLRIKKDYSCVMICGNPNMLVELTDHFTDEGWKMGTIAEPADFTIEKSFVDRA